MKPITLTAALAIALTLTACEEKSSKKAAAENGGNTFTDSRDGKAYKTVKIGEQTWMAENLNYEAKGSLCYDNKPVNCAKYGRLYKLETAEKACPSGWHLPSEEEWDKLIAITDGDLKAKSGWNDYEGKSGNGKDKFGFSALPGGSLCDNDTRGCGNVGEEANYLASGYKGDCSIMNKKAAEMGAEGGCYNYHTLGIHNGGHVGFYEGGGSTSSVRCVKGEAVAAKAPATPAPVAAKCGGVKLVESISTGERLHKFEYDSKDRIVKISSYYDGNLYETLTLTYSGNNLAGINGA